MSFTMSSWVAFSQRLQSAAETTLSPAPGICTVTLSPSMEVTSPEM